MSRRRCPSWLGAAALAAGLTLPAAVAAAPPPAVHVAGAPPARATPLFPPHVARALMDRAGRSGRRAPDLRRWYRLPGAPSPAPPPSADSLCRIVTADDGFASIPQAATVPLPDLAALQDARRDLALDGLPPGGDGTGVRVGSVEFDWDADHVELDGRVPPRPAYRRAGGGRDVSHGTAALAVIGARRDGQGVTGLAAGAALQPVSPLRGPDASDYTPPVAIALAASRLRAGDVLLVELQSESLGPADTGAWGPAVADAIAAATAAGIVVVLPAGNAGQDVAAFGAPASDTAILVGAGLPSGPGGGPGARWAGGNFGRRVDVQGPGQGVVTATAFPTYYDVLVGGEGDPHTSYTHCFNGTSSAAAVVAGSIAALQGVARAVRGAPFTPAEVLARLQATGRPQPDPLAGRIGPLPQIRAAADLQPPAAPSGLQPGGDAAVPAGEVLLRWTSPADDAGGSGRADDLVVVDGREAGRVPAGTGEMRVRLDPGRHTWTVRALDRAGNAAGADGRLLVVAGAGGAEVRHAAHGAGVVRRAGWVARRRALVLRVTLRPGARVRVAGRVRAVRRGIVVVPMARPRAVRVLISGRGLAAVAYRVRSVAGRGLVATRVPAAVTSPRSPARP